MKKNEEKQAEKERIEKLREQGVKTPLTEDENKEILKKKEQEKKERL